MLKNSYIRLVVGAAMFGVATAAAAIESATVIESPDGRNAIVLKGAISDEDFVRFSVRRDGSVGPF